MIFCSIFYSILSCTILTDMPWDFLNLDCTRVSQTNRVRSEKHISYGIFHTVIGTTIKIGIVVNVFILEYRSMICKASSVLMWSMSVHRCHWQMRTISTKLPLNYDLTHWCRLTHTCVSDLTIIGSDNGLTPGRRQAIIWTNVLEYC